MLPIHVPVTLLLLLGNVKAHAQPFLSFGFCNFCHPLVSLFFLFHPIPFFLT
ncbi:hypothetical protein K450DRAFT_226757 [Umbelopsis ramanniana AG]|uniref:Uncharacterized protein n=1 Tax=Umbelopsis ramanniana AG TaxID=1314678 RepID=A0AAD5EGE7_UMBRA|nr:uncharacterized protein K450DRAFT_226757 [Umbelopsis ramanniana AG]KAI8582754.1 hypothetical protein K450DRAFT_226757 [Umbelopsis ramanniana AG]